MKNKQLYIAYGSNINLEQMAYRCPHSKVVGTSEIKDYELEFRGVATIVPNKGARVPVLIWELDERDLPTLNKYEGYPSFYRQEKMTFEMDGKTYEGMAYLMNRGTISPPSCVQKVRPGTGSAGRLVEWAGHQNQVLQHDFAGIQRKRFGREISSNSS